MRITPLSKTQLPRLQRQRRVKDGAPIKHGTTKLYTSTVQSARVKRQRWSHFIPVKLYACNGFVVTEPKKGVFVLLPIDAPKDSDVAVLTNKTTKQQRIQLTLPYANCIVRFDKHSMRVSEATEEQLDAWCNYVEVREIVTSYSDYRAVKPIYAAMFKAKECAIRKDCEEK